MHYVKLSRPLYKGGELSITLEVENKTDIDAELLWIQSKVDEINGETTPKKTTRKRTPKKKEEKVEKEEKNIEGEAALLSFAEKEKYVSDWNALTAQKVYADIGEKAWGDLSDEDYTKLVDDRFKAEHGLSKDEYIKTDVAKEK